MTNSIRDQIAKDFSVELGSDTHGRVRSPDETAALLDRLCNVAECGAEHGAQGWYSDGDFSSDADWCYGIGAEIQALESALDIDDGAVFDLYREAHSEAFDDGTINPGDRGDGTCWRFQFGSVGTTTVYLWASSLESGLEMAAEWLLEHAPGHIMPEGDAHLEELRREACAEAGLTYPVPPSSPHGDGLDCEAYHAAFESAEADLTYTESGYLTSYEWYVDECDPPGPSD